MRYITTGCAQSASLSLLVVRFRVRVSLRREIDHFPMRFLVELSPRQIFALFMSVTVASKFRVIGRDDTEVWSKSAAANRR